MDLVEPIIDALLNIFPLDRWLNLWLGISENQARSIVFLLLCLLLAAVLVLFHIGKKLLEKQSLLRKSRDLRPQWEYKDVQNYRRHYIPTQGQNASPAREDEPGISKKFIVRKELIPFFLKEGFNEKTDSERFYLILADSGMGKTTFMINLYLAYHSFWNRRRKQKMRLFRFSHPNTMREIADLNAKGIEEVKNTILLLDALDEDPNIVSNDPNVPDEMAFRKRLDEIIDATRNFCEVVITCRTQYFPGQEQDPYELKIRRTDEKGFYTLNKLYISPFTNEEVKTYLKKKYGWLPFINKTKKERAARVIAQSKHLVMRPMMLSYIDYLVEDHAKFDSVYSVYETLVEKWLLREGEKRKPSVERPDFIENLRQLSDHAATSIFKNWKSENRMYLTKAEAVQLAENHQIELRPEEVTGQSLLTCDGVGNWKFAHKSIMEFFLAKAVLDGRLAADDFSLGGMDMAQQFFFEKIGADMVFIKGGTFKMGDKFQVTLSDFEIAKYPVTQKLWRAIMGTNPSHFKGDDLPVEQVSWDDCQQFLKKLNEKIPGKTWRLPTEAEWEFAARGGNFSKKTKYAGSNDLNEVGWYDGNSDSKTHPVGQKKANELGIYDLSGNVWEWCQDWYGDYPSEPQTNPTGAKTGDDRVSRGGSWFDGARYCRVSYRFYYSPAHRYGDLGFRPVRQ